MRLVYGIYYQETWWLIDIFLILKRYENDPFILILASDVDAGDDSLFHLSNIVL